MSKLDEILDKMLQKNFRGFAARVHKSERELLDDYNLCVERAVADLKQWALEQRIDEAQKHWLATMQEDYSLWSAKRMTELRKQIRGGDGTN